MTKRGGTSDVAAGLERQSRIIGGVLAAIGAASLAVAVYLSVQSVVSLRALLCFGLLGVASLGAGVTKLLRGHDPGSEA